MSKADDIFWRQFGGILVILTIFTIVVFFVARSIAGEELQKMLSSASSVAERIQPVAKVRVGDPSKSVAVATPAASAATITTAAASNDGVDGEAVYSGACIACHAAGVAGAPKLGDEAAWTARVGLGEDALVASVVNGKGAMPPKAGNPALTEAQIRAAVVHMLGAVSAGGSAAAAPAATAATAAAANPAPAAAANPAPAAAGKPGDQVYNSACVACHVSGVAGAPKLTDKDNWTTRAATGFEALVTSVLNGKGAMPPKGGNPALEQADVENSVRYMLEQAGVSAAGS